MTDSPRSFAARFLVASAALSLGLCPPGSAQLQTKGAKFLFQDSPGVGGTAEIGDDFGRALAVGDFNCDGFDDLAVGVPFEDTDDDVTHAGAVNVFYGGVGGLTSAEIWSQESSGVPGSNEAHDHFGEALAAFRRPGSSCDSLAVGAPDEDVTTGVTHVNAGAVFVFRGTGSGLVADGLLVEGRDGVPESPEDDDRFGAAISQGPTVNGGSDCSGSAQDMTLWVGAPGEGLDIGDNGDGVVIRILMPCDGADGSGDIPSMMNCDSSDLTTKCRVVSANDFNLPFEVNPYDGDFGASLAWLGRVGTTAYPELGWETLAIGVPFADADGPVTNSGSVLEMDPTLDANDSFYWLQGIDLGGASEAGDHFGEELAGGDFDDDGRIDLAIGIPDEDVGSTGEAGAVHIVRNSTAGLTEIGDDLLTQEDLAGLTSEGSDRFGGALAVGDFDGDGVDDLAIGTDGENLVDPRVVVNGGAASVLYGIADAGLSTTGAQHFDADDLLFNGAREQSFFGAALAAGDFDGNGIDDLAAGEPGNQDLVNSEGFIWVMYGADDGVLSYAGFANNLQSVAESAGTIQVQVNRIGSAVTSANATVRVKTSAPGTATAGSDYNFTSANAHWDAGELGIQSVSIPIVDDSDAELAETIRLEIVASGVEFAETNPVEMEVKINDNDPASFEFQFESYDVAENAGTASLIVARTGNTFPAASVSWTTTSGSGLVGAVAGQDFTASGGTLTWTAGQAGGKSVSIPITNDATPEGDESFLVSLFSPTGGVQLSSPFVTTVTIAANDGGIFTDGFESGSTGRWSDEFP